MSKCGLVLEGGGMRGLYTAGVLDYFLDFKMNFKDITTVSAGACHAVSYISKQRGRSYVINTKYCSDKRYISFGRFLRGGSIFGMDFIFKEIPQRLEPMDFEAYHRQGSRLTVALTNLETAKAEYFDIEDVEKDIDYLVATCSLPVFSPAVTIEGRSYYDGGITDSIPVQKALDKGNDKVVVILTQNKGYQKQPAGGGFVYKRKFRNYPGFIKAIAHRHEMYNGELALIERLEQEGKALVLRPTMPLSLSRFEKDEAKLKAVYQNGYDDAKDNFEKIMEFCRGAENFTE